MVRNLEFKLETSIICNLEQNFMQIYSNASIKKYRIFRSISRSFFHKTQAWCP